jgi:hypothetical protein
MHPLLVPQQNPIDQAWRNELRFNLPDDLYLYLMPPQAELEYLRGQFERSNHQELPILRPSDVYRDAFLDQYAGLQELRDAIAMKEQNEHIRALYLDRIDEQMANCVIWFAADDQNADTFEKANEFIYGMPNTAIHAATCSWLRMFASDQLTHPDELVVRAANNVLNLVPDLKGDTRLLIPNEETYRNVVLAHEEYFERLFAGTTIPEHTITAELGDAIISQVLRNVDSDYMIGDSDDSFWGVKHITKQVLRPVNYALSPQSFKGIVAHEFGSHLLERSNGLRGPLQLAAIGLDRYEHGNEGRAFIREQVVMGSLQAMQQHYSWQHNIMKHIGVSLGVGVSGKRYNFKEVYDVLYAAYNLWAALQYENPTQVQRQAADNAWAMATRVLKGTDGQGGAYRKDIVYVEGNARCWQIAKTDPARILAGDFGKFDIANQGHIDRLTALGVLPRS